MGRSQHAGPPKRGFFSRFLSLLIMLVLILGCSWLLRVYVIQPYEVPSGSMEDTIETGDRIFAEKITFDQRSPQPGDIVTFDDPELASRTLVKRVIAIGGQTVNLVNGKVVVDGITLDEPYTEGKPSYPLTTAEGVTVSYPYTVPVGYVWVMGDNRTNSADSRYFGPVSASSITGKAVFVYWPINHIGSLS